MIRDLTKSVLSFSWALSLLGIKQAINMGRSDQNGGELFTPVTQVAVGQLDESMKGVYRSGDSLQSRMIDMAFTTMNPANWANPVSFARGMAMGPSAQTPGGPAEPQPTSMMDAAAWMNPGVWFNPANWNVARFMGGCGQAGSPGSSQTTGQAGGNSTSGGSPTGWGPMPNQTS